MSIVGFLRDRQADILVGNEAGRRRPGACEVVTLLSEQKAANHIGMLRRSARPDRVNLRSKKKLQLAQCFGGRFAREFPKVMHHVHLIVVPEFMCDVGPRFR